MNKLLSIQNDVTRMANAISSAINIEVVIVDNNLRIISGTGRYADRVGLMEENGDITIRSNLRQHPAIRKTLYLPGHLNRPFVRDGRR